MTDKKKWEKLKVRLDDLLRISEASTRGGKAAARIIKFIQEEMKEIENDQ